MKTNIRKLREQKKITQTALAKELNIARSTLCQYEKGTREADYSTLVHLANFFSTTVDYIICRLEYATNETNHSTIDLEINAICKNLTTENKLRLIGYAHSLATNNQSRPDDHQRK